jgi:ribose 5-phosphate isomerase B
MIALGADHAGFAYKEQARTLLTSMGLQWKDFGTSAPDSVDYPDFAHAVSSAVGSGEFEYGLLICGTGIGMSIVANKHRGVRAAVVESVPSARLSRQHNNANILALGARIITWERAEEIIRVFFTTPFEGGRHERRVNKIHSLTQL